MSKDNQDINSNCSFQSKEMNTNTEIENITEEQIGAWEIAYRLESMEDLDKAVKDLFEKARNKGVNQCF